MGGFSLTVEDDFLRAGPFAAIVDSLDTLMDGDASVRLVVTIGAMSSSTDRATGPLATFGKVVVALDP